MTLKANINRHMIGNYLADAWNVDIDEYSEYSNKDLLNLLAENGWLQEFKEYAL